MVDVTNVTNDDNDEQVPTRPNSPAKDPLADGDTLVNPSNSSEETEYDKKEPDTDTTPEPAEEKTDSKL